MLPSAGPRGAHTARSDRPGGTTTDEPETAPTRRSSVASAHPKPGYQRWYAIMWCGVNREGPLKNGKDKKMGTKKNGNSNSRITYVVLQY